MTRTRPAANLYAVTRDPTEGLDSLEALARYAFEQGVAPRHLRIDEMFPASLRET